MSKNQVFAYQTNVNDVGFYYIHGTGFLLVVNGKGHCVTLIIGPILSSTRPGLSHC